MAYELEIEHHSQHLRLHSNYGSYSFPKGRWKDLPFRVCQRVKEGAEVQVTHKRSAVVAVDHYSFREPAGALSWRGWNLFQAVAVRDFKMSCSLSPGLKRGRTVLTSFLRDSSLICSLKK